MGWREGYLDVILIPLSLLLSITYHGWLWRKVRSQPLETHIGINSAGWRIWLLAMMRDSEKMNMLVVQTIRNALMGMTLMASTSILLSMGLAAVISSNYSVKEPMEESGYGAHGEHVTAFKYACVLFLLLSAFICYSLAVRVMNQVSFLASIPGADGGPVDPEYVWGLMEKGFVFGTVGDRLFYAALPLLLWIIEPALVFLASLAMVLILYAQDTVGGEGKESSAL